MRIVGLTGSIGMGKSTAADRFRKNGVEVFDADACVHELYEGAAAPLIETAFPGTAVDGVVDREKLLAALLADPNGFAKLERIVHPMVRERERRFLQLQHDKGADIVVLEIPLLIETGADKLVDAVVVVSAGPKLQRERVMERPGMTEQKFKEILSRQMSDKDKRARADFIVDTSGEIEQSAKEVDRIIEKLIDGYGPCRAYREHWAPGVNRPA